MALLGRRRPRDRQVQRPTRARSHVPQGEAAARYQDAPRLGVEPALVRDVHLDVLADHHVERCVVERELGDVGGADLDHVAEPDRVVQPGRDLAVLGREVDGGDVRAVLGGDEAGGPADPGAGVEDSVARVTRARSMRAAVASRPRLWKSSSIARSDGWSAMVCLPASARARSIFERVRPVA